ncbi:hypothetical protein CTA1_1845 [Colletotrichum tanaceti]|uniref:Uncharacterized protein n=1 Tax=Colletotrichum tanaceti TaxID=1306861 RepID=A0A4U6WZI7_9PEZI|nr:hypothetical protein CTA1_1845 [Colletotrichum tanaceti]
MLRGAPGALVFSLILELGLKEVLEGLSRLWKPSIALNQNYPNLSGLTATFLGP